MGFPENEKSESPTTTVSATTSIRHFILGSVIVGFVAGSMVLMLIQNRQMQNRLKELADELDTEHHDDAMGRNMEGFSESDGGQLSALRDQFLQHVAADGNVLIRPKDLDEKLESYFKEKSKEIAMGECTCPEGEKGEAGSRGPEGEPGDKGAIGDKGEQGAKGEDGSDGRSGMKGDKGDTGGQGFEGRKGTPGRDKRQFTIEKGNKGEKGQPGES